MRYEQEGYGVLVYRREDDMIVELRGEVDLDFRLDQLVGKGYIEVDTLKIDKVIELLPDLEAVEELLGEDLLGIVS